jgi:hypothetical protein
MQAVHTPVHVHDGGCTQTCRPPCGSVLHRSPCIQTPQTPGRCLRGCSLPGIACGSWRTLSSSPLPPLHMHSAIPPPGTACANWTPPSSHTHNSPLPPAPAQVLPAQPGRPHPNIHMNHPFLRPYVPGTACASWTARGGSSTPRLPTRDASPTSPSRPRSEDSPQTAGRCWCDALPRSSAAWWSVWEGAVGRGGSQDPRGVPACHVRSSRPHPTVVRSRQVSRSGAAPSPESAPS